MTTNNQFRAAKHRIDAARRAGDPAALSAAYAHMRQLSEADRLDALLHKARTSDPSALPWQP